MLSIGVDEDRGSWKTCLLEDGQVVEVHVAADTASVLAYLEQTCATYPEPVMMVSLDECHRDGGEMEKFLIAIESLNLNSYNVPSFHALPTISWSRKLLRRRLGSAHMLCNTAALLYRLRQREAGWHEMTFLLLETYERAFNVAVIEAGRIVNGISATPGWGEPPETHQPRYRRDEPPVQDDRTHAGEEAFWEKLTYSLAGLLAVHHIEDIVILGERGDDVIARFENIYQFYSFPRDEREQAGYEAAVGAALLGAGLSMQGIAAEVVERLQVPLVQGATFS